MDHRISQMKEVQRTTIDELVALASTYNTKTSCLPPTTFLYLWLWNDIHFAVVEGTQKTSFSTGMNFKISYLKGFQRTTTDGPGALTSQ